jgi:hypothetical protein
LTTQTSTKGALVRQSTSYIGDGELTAYAVGFPVVDRSRVVVKVDGSITAAFTWNSASTTITFTVAPADLAAILITDATSKHASAAVLPNPLETKSTLGLADQPARTAVTSITETRSSGGNVVIKSTDDATAGGPLAGSISLTRTDN